MTNKSKKCLLPKRIAGVKVPKSVRKGRIGEAMASPTGQAVIAEVLMAAAQAAKASDAKGGAATNETLVEVADRLRENGAGKGGKAADEASGAIVFAMGEAARTFVDALNRRRVFEAEGAKAQSAEGVTGALEAPDSKKKPPVHEGVTH